MKNFKINQKVWTLIVNVTNFYVSFKIGEGKYLGKIEPRVSRHYDHMVEYSDDDVEYLSLEDIFASQEDAEKHLLKILQSKYGEKEIRAKD